MEMMVLQTPAAAEPGASRKRMIQQRLGPAILGWAASRQRWPILDDPS